MYHAHQPPDSAHAVNRTDPGLHALRIGISREGVALCCVDDLLHRRSARGASHRSWRRGRWRRRYRKRAAGLGGGGPHARAASFLHEEKLAPLRSAPPQLAHVHGHHRAPEKKRRAGPTQQPHTHGLIVERMHAVPRPQRRHTACHRVFRIACWRGLHDLIPRAPKRRKTGKRKQHLNI